MLGGADGKEDPCVGLALIRKIQAEGRTCPRYELPEEDGPAADLAFLAAKVGADHPLFHKLFDLHGGGLDHEERLALFWRVIEVVGDPGIAARIQAARDRALREK